MMTSEKWRAVEEGAAPGEEQRLMGFDFCKSNDSNEVVRKICIELAKLPCE